MVAFAPEVPEITRRAWSRGFQYWNAALGKRIFFIVEQPLSEDPHVVTPGGLLIVGMASKAAPIAETAAAETQQYLEPNGCVYASRIGIAQIATRYLPDEQETVARHEAGHVLGLAHTLIPGDLMFPSINIGVQNPVDASDAELAALFGIY